jgi:hypothetical protein
MDATSAMAMMLLTETMVVYEKKTAPPTFLYRRVLAMGTLVSFSVSDGL